MARGVSKLLGFAAEPPTDLPFGGALPAEIAQEALEEHGKDRDRHGTKLTARLVLRLVIYLPFFRGLSIPRVLDRVAGLFGVPASWQGVLPHATSIAQARTRLGFEVVRTLFWRFVDHLIPVVEACERFHGLVPVAFDGSMLDTPDSPANATAFKRPGSRKGSAGFPKLRFVVLVSTVSHMILGCVAGPSKGRGTGETSLVQHLLSRLRPDWLVLMDRGLCAFHLLKSLGSQPFFVRKPTGRTSVTPKKVGRALRPRKDCWVDYLPSSVWGEQPLRLRWIRIKLPRKTRRRSRWVEFLTNLDPARFPYETLVELYLERWEVEFVFREIKSDLLEKQFFRSREPRRVLQELYGLLIAYNAVRARMVQAAKLANVRPRDLSFAQSAMLLRLAELSGVETQVLVSVVSRTRIQKRSKRSYPRVVKKPVSKFAANRRRAVPT